MEQFLSPDDVERIARTNPGTTFGQMETKTVVPPDTRSRLKKLVSSAPAPITTTERVLLGRFVRMREVGNPQYNGGYVLTFQGPSNTERTVTLEGPSGAIGSIFVQHLAAPRPRPSAPPVEEDPVNVGGRKRRSRSSRVKKQTRRSQRKRRNTKRR
jgi:hypothetical protein